MPPPPSLSPVPEDELMSITQLRDRPGAAHSNPNLRTSMPNGWGGGNGHGKMNGGVNGNGHRGRPPPRPRPQSYPPVKGAPAPTDYYYSPRSQDTASMVLRADEQFYVPPAPGTVTVASSLSDIEVDKRPWYRRKYMFMVYICVFIIVVGVVVAVIIMFGR